MVEERRQQECSPQARYEDGHDIGHRLRSLLLRQHVDRRHDRLPTHGFGGLFRVQVPIVVSSVAARQLGIHTEGYGVLNHDGRSFRSPHRRHEREPLRSLQDLPRQPWASRAD